MRHAVAVALALCSGTSCRAPIDGVQPPAAAPAIASVAPSARQTLCDLDVTSPTPSDSELMQRASRRADALIRSVLGAAVVAQCSTVVRCKTFVLPFETCSAKPGLATTLTQYETDAQGAAAIFILAPSKHPASFQSAVGTAADESYFEKLTTHEVAGVFLDCATRVKGSGWRFFSAPAWFYQGIEEYLGLRAISNVATRGLYWKRYVAAVSAHVASIDFTSSVKVVDTYKDGAMLVAYVWHRVGRKGVACALQSNAADFDIATRGCGFAGWDGFREWLAGGPAMPS